MKILLKKFALVFALSVATLTSIYAIDRMRFSLETESDPALEIEQWMVQDEYWTSGLEVTPIVMEEELNLEPWMVDDCYWK